MNIDEFTQQYFDESSRAWLENKIKMGHSYVYKCQYIHSNKKQCSKAEIYSGYCKQHYILLDRRGL